MLLSVVVVNWNSADDLEQCLEALRQQTHRELEIIVVDNGSTDGSVEMVRAKYPDTVLLAETENLGFAEGCNRGIARSTGPWVAMLNNDAFAEPAWAAELVRAAENADHRVGALQSLLLFHARPDEINSTGIELTWSGGGRDRLEGKPRASSEPQREGEMIFAATAGAAAYRRTMLDQIRLPTGWFDAAHFMYFEDMDLGWRASLAGWDTLLVARSAVLHRYHGSSGRRGATWLYLISRRNRLRTLVKNASVPFLLLTFPRSLLDVVDMTKRGGTAVLPEVWAALRESLGDRRTVRGMARRRRLAVEARWLFPR